MVVFMKGGVGDMRMLLVAGVIVGSELVIVLFAAMELLATLDGGVLAGMLELLNGGVLNTIFSFCEAGAVPDGMAELAGAVVVEFANGGVLEGMREDEPPVDIGMGMVELELPEGFDIAEVEFMDFIGAIEREFPADEAPVDMGTDMDVGMPPEDAATPEGAVAAAIVEFAKGAALDGFREEPPPVDIGIGMDELVLPDGFDSTEDEFLADEAPVDIGMDMGVDMPPEDAAVPEGATAAAIVEFAKGGELEGRCDEDTGTEVPPVDIGIGMDELVPPDGLDSTEDEFPADEAPVDIGTDMGVDIPPEDAAAPEGAVAAAIVEFAKGAELDGFREEAPPPVDIGIGMDELVLPDGFDIAEVEFASGVEVMAGFIVEVAFFGMAPRVRMGTGAVPLLPGILDCDIGIELFADPAEFIDD